MIETLLKNKTAKEKAKLKSLELAKVKFSNTFTKDSFVIKIVGEVEPIEVNGVEGIQVFAQAWKDDKQLGFGTDGSVDIERFRIFNPPVLVDSPTGEVVREWTDDIDGKVKQRKLKYDPMEAIKQSILHTVKLVGKEGTEITIGKIGNTTSTFYPDADPESTSVDGFANKGAGLSSWAASRSAAGDGSNDTSTSGIVVQSEQAGANDYPIKRTFYLFDTSALPDGDTIDSATLSIYSTGSGNDTESSSPADLVLTESNPASNTAIVNSDYDIGNWASFTTEFASRIDLGTFIGTSQYHVFTLNASGLSNISKTSISKFGVRAANDFDNNAPTARSYGFGYYADQTGTTNDPKLVVIHSGGTAYNMPVTVGVFVLTGIANILNRGWVIATTVGSFILTGIAATFSTGKGMIASVGSFVLTGLDVVLEADVPAVWTNITKHTASWTNKVKNSSIWTNK